MPRERFAQAQKNKNDEFYTQLSDIEDELRHYKEHFKGKVVLCNCDDPFESNFFKYFAMNFNHLGLKKLICTSYAGSPISYTEFDDLPLLKTNHKLPYMIEITKVEDYNSDGAEDLADIEYLLKNNQNTLTILDGDGDFRSEECIGFLEEADIVVTNPPFSLFREYVAQLIKYKKSFLILGNNNAITYKEIFPLIKDNKLWLGYGSNKTLEFRLSDNYKKWNYVKNGVKYGKVPAISWFTNLDTKKRHEDLILYKEYNAADYPKYDNYDAININKTTEIPCDYSGVMGVPITFLDKYNPNQFEIVGLAPERGKFILQNKKYKNAVQHNRDGSTQGGNKVNDGPVLAYNTVPKKFPYYTASNSEKFLQVLYARILIKRKDLNEN